MTSQEFTVPEDLVTRELSRGQLGDGFFGGVVPVDDELNQALNANNELLLNIPAHQKDCKLWLHFTGGQINLTGLPESITTTADATVSPVLVSDMDANAFGQFTATDPVNADIFSYVYCMDGTGDARGSVVIKFPDTIGDNGPGDHVMWVWSETCSPTRPLYTADIDIPNIFESTGQDRSIGGGFQNTMRETESSFTTNCPALIFGAGRHVLHPGAGTANGGSGNTLTDASWFNENLGGTSQEIYDIVSLDSFDCQSGLGMDFLPNAGTYNWDWAPNASTGADAGWANQALTVVLPFSCDPFVRSADLIVEGTEAVLTSNLCATTANTECSADAAFTYDLNADAVLTIVPVVNGIVQPANAVTVNGAGAGSVNVPVTVNGTINQGQTRRCQIGYEAYIEGGTQGSTVFANEYTTTFRTL
jgi:hypothetical protein